MNKIDKESVGSNSWCSSLALVDEDEDDGGWVRGGGNCYPFPSRSTPLRTPPDVPQQKSPDGGSDWDVCFSCRKKGHWAKDCPAKDRSSKTNGSSGASTNGDDGGGGGVAVDLMCPCGAGCCNILISKTALNPNRKFYRCPLYGPRACKFFGWCDDVILATGRPPACPCGAGLCCVIIQQHQHSRQPSSYFFVCPIKKGQGACNFIQPADATTYTKGEGSMSSSSTTFSPKSTLTHYFSGETTTTPSSSSTSTTSDKTTVEDESGDKSFQPLEGESSVPFTPIQHDPLQLETNRGVPWGDKVRTVLNFQEQEEDSPVKEEGDEQQREDELPLYHYRRRHKRLRDWDPKNDDVFVNNSGVDHNCDILAADLEEVSCTDTVAIRATASVLKPDKVFVHPRQQRQAQFFCEISPADGPANLLRASPAACDHGTSTMIQNYLEPTVIYRILGFQIEGWCGRLVFPPSRCLTFPAPRPFFCCVFPSFDPIFVPGDDHGVEAESSKQNADDGRLLGGGIANVGPSDGGGVDQAPPCKISPCKISQGNNNNIMTLSILDVFKQAAADLEERLLNELESMEPHEHESMVQGANLVFHALDNLSVVNYSSFKERVMGFIGCAVSLSELESSSAISQEHYPEQEVLDKYDRLQMELEDISSLYSETSAALTASNNHLNFLMQEETRIKQMLQSIQAEISCYQVQNEEINSRLDKITQDMNRAKSSVQVAKGEVEQAHRLHQQREARRDVAKASFERARSKLRDADHI